VGSSGVRSIYDSSSVPMFPRPRAFFMNYCRFPFSSSARTLSSGSSLISSASPKRRGLENGDSPVVLSSKICKLSIYGAKELGEAGFGLKG